MTLRIGVTVQHRDSLTNLSSQKGEWKLALEDSPLSVQECGLVQHFLFFEESIGCLGKK